MTAKQKANIVRFKKAVSIAKSLRQKNKNLTHPEAVKLAFKQMGGTEKKKVVPKKSTNLHKDTKSHNVNIKVVSGWRKGGTAIIEKSEGKVPKFKNVRVVRNPKGGIFKPGTFSNFTTLQGFFDTSVLKELDDLKKQYYKLSKKYHPDAGGTTAQFQELQKEYEKLLNNLLKGSGFSAEQKENEKVLDEAIRQIIDSIIHLETISIEVIGKWLWIGASSGLNFDTPTYNVLKSAGLSYIKKAGRPFMVYKGVESKGRGKSSMDEIKAKYGSEKFEAGKGRKLTGVKINKVKLKNAILKVKKALDKRPV